MNGIGSYFSPETFRPVGRPQSTPVSGVGAYYNPEMFSPVNPPESVPATSTSGLGVSLALEENKSSAAIGILLLIALGFFLMRRK